MTLVALADGSLVPSRASPQARLELMLAALTVALSPVNYLRLEAMYFTAGDLCGVATLLAMLANRSVRLDFYGPATPLWLVSFLLFLGGLVAGSVVNGDPLAGLTMFIQYSYSLLVLPVILAGRSLEQTLLLIKVFVFSMTAIMLHGIYLVNFVSDPDPLLVTGSGRLSTLVERENAASAMAAFAISFGIFLLIDGKLRPIVFLAVLGILLYGVLLTGSNTGFAATGLGAILVLVFSGRIRAVLLGLPIIAAFLFLLVNFGADFLPDVFGKRVLGALSSGDIGQAGTFTARYDLIKEAIRLADGTIFLGLGADQYRAISALHAPVHNVYLLVLTEGGLVSLFGLCGLLMTSVYLGMGMMRSPETLSRGALTLAILICFALVLNAFAHFYARFWHIPITLAASMSVARPDRTGSS